MSLPEKEKRIIRKTADVVTWLRIGSYVVAGLFVLAGLLQASVTDIYGETRFQFSVLLSVWLYGGLAFLLLYGFAALIENSQEQVDRTRINNILLDEILQTLQNMEKEPQKVVETKREAKEKINSFSPQVTPEKTEAPMKKQPQQMEDGKIKCSACGHEQRADRTQCWKCGTLFE